MLLKFKIADLEKYVTWKVYLEGEFKTNSDSTKKKR